MLGPPTVEVQGPSVAVFNGASDCPGPDDGFSRASSLIRDKWVGCPPRHLARYQHNHKASVRSAQRHLPAQQRQPDSNTQRRPIHTPYAKSIIRSDSL
ncbi:hypothetical protein CDV31_011258 [Fusarium ambrosium]|uniref:Uncharacterized protein n=1 Tax=Fusarium ambrosium TaxID=131363 RepID=A0A428THY9_9HYPO|nr:hypothetical protein CDV31_011258 [Fusarium ambrosium]